MCGTMQRATVAAGEIMIPGLDRMIGRTGVVTLAGHPSIGSVPAQLTLGYRALCCAGRVAEAETRNRKLLTDSATRWGRRTPKLHAPGPSPPHGAGTLASA